MKNILSVLVGLLVVLGCTDTNKKQKNPRRIELSTEAKNYDQNYEVYTLEGCEYILVGAGNNRWGSHKGNCKNPIHYTK
jgi:hypothetical protein